MTHGVRQLSTALCGRNCCWHSTAWSA